MKQKYRISWGYNHKKLDMVFVTSEVSNEQEAIDEFYEAYPDAFCEQPKPYK